MTGSAPGPGPWAASCVQFVPSHRQVSSNADRSSVPPNRMACPLEASTTIFSAYRGFGALAGESLFQLPPDHIHVSPNVLEVFPGALPPKRRTPVGVDAMAPSSRAGGL